jgi:HEPN domain-containing protein
MYLFAKQYVESSKARGSVIERGELRKLARGRLKDAQTLFESKRYDGSVYLCGYAIELALKARICRTLKWTHFSETRREFRGLESFRTHDLDILIQLTGVEANVKGKSLAEWSVVTEWDPQLRYQAVGTAIRSYAENMIEATGV